MFIIKFIIVFNKIYLIVFKTLLDKRIGFGIRKK